MFVELVKTLETEVVVSDEIQFSYRIEVFFDPGRKVFFPKLWRCEFLRVQPTFPQVDGEPAFDLADEQVLIRDAMVDEDLVGESVDAVLAGVEAALEKRFGSNLAPV